MNSTTNHIDPEDLALYALHLLSAEDEATIKQHLGGCDECRAELNAVQGDLAIFALTVEVQSPAAASRDRLMNAIAREPRAQTATAVADRAVEDRERRDVAPVTPISFGRRDRDLDLDARSERPRARVLPWLGWAAAAGLAFLTVQLYRERQNLRDQVTTASHRTSDLELQAANARRTQETLTDAGALRVSLTRSKQAPEPQGKATYIASKGALVFIASNLEPLQPYKTYELWIIPASGQAPVAAGLFHPDSKGNASVILPQLPAGVEAKAFGVTIEDEGGSSGPTMPILLSGAAAGA